MAKIQDNTVMTHFSGRIDMLCFYKVCGKTYVRMVSSLSSKRVKKDRAFRRTMENAALLGRASRIGSAVYQALPKTFRQFWMYRAFTGEAMQLLREGRTDAEVNMTLWKMYAEVWVKKENAAKEQAEPPMHSTILPIGRQVVIRQSKVIIASLPLFRRYIYQEQHRPGKTVVIGKADCCCDHRLTAGRAREPAIAC